jgi:hypothetical protein
MMSSYEKCPVCKQWGWLDSHKCGPYYLVRREDEDRAEERVQHASDPGQAAERWLERHFSDCDYPNSMTVLVVDSAETTEWRISIEVVPVPEFTGTIEEETKLQPEEVEE